MGKLKGHHLLDDELVELVCSRFNISITHHIAWVADANRKRALLDVPELGDEGERIVRMIEACLDWKGGHPTLPIATENLWREDIEDQAKGLVRV